MIWLTAIGRLVLGFIFGTLVLWLCSLTVKTARANIRTAAIYNAIMTVLGGVLLALGLLFLHTGSGITGGMFLVTTILTLIVSFWLLMRMYDITFLATLWLVFAMWAVNTLVEKLINVVT